MRNVDSSLNLNITKGSSYVNQTYDKSEIKSIKKYLKEAQEETNVLMNARQPPHKYKEKYYINEYSQKH